MRLNALLSFRIRVNFMHKLRARSRSPSHIGTSHAHTPTKNPIPKSVKICNSLSLFAITCLHVSIVTSNGWPTTTADAVAVAIAVLDEAMVKLTRMKMKLKSIQCHRKKEREKKLRLKIIRKKNNK